MNTFLELARKKATEPKRVVELAAYFTHCNLQPVCSRMLSLMSCRALCFMLTT